MKSIRWIGWVALVALLVVPLAVSSAWAAPDFAGAPLTGPKTLNVTFTPTYTGTPDSVTWTFGDGGFAKSLVGTAYVTSHAYVASGAYTVRMIKWPPAVGDTVTKTGTPALTGYVNVNQGFTGTPLTGTAPLAVTFTRDPVGIGITPDSTTWDFGDGGYANGAGPVGHMYNTPGARTVVMRVWYGITAKTATNSSYVNVNALDFSGTPLTGAAGASVLFTPGTPSTQTYDSTSWNFGDGDSVTTLTAPSPQTHVYAEAGVYTVVMTGWHTGSTDQVVSKAKYVVLTPNFAGTPLAGVVPLPVTFTPGAIGGDASDSITWTFGDGGYANGGGVKNHTYNIAGTYTVNMTVWYTGATDQAVTKPAYVNAQSGSYSTWPGLGTTSAQVTQYQDVSQCTNMAWRSGLGAPFTNAFMKRWYNYAGPTATKQPVLSFKIVNLGAVDDTLKQFYVHSLIERTYAINNIYLYRDAATAGLPDTSYYYDAGDALLQTVPITTAFQNNDSILFSGLSNVIAANDTAWYHLVVDMNPAQITGNLNYNNTGVMVEIRAGSMLLNSGGPFAGPGVDLDPDCTPASNPSNNAYSIIIDNLAPLCATLDLSFLQDVTCPPCDGSKTIINLGDSLLITLNLDSTGSIIAIDSCVTGWPKIFVREFTNNSGAVSMGRVKGTFAQTPGLWNNFVYVSDPDTLAGPFDGFLVPTSGVNHPIDVDSGFYYLVAETKDVAGNVGRCSTLVNYKIDTKKPATTNAPTFTLYYDSLGDGFVTPGDTIRVYWEMSRNIDSIGEICSATTILYGWYGAPQPLTLTDAVSHDGKFEAKFRVTPGILDCAAGAWQDSIWIHVTDNACNADSVRAVLNKKVDNRPPQTNAWAKNFYRLLDTDSNGCLMIGEKVRIRLSNVSIDTDIVAIYANLLKVGLGDSAGIVYSRHPLYNQGGGIWLLDWTLGAIPQDSAKQATQGPFRVVLYGVDDAGNEVVDSTGVLSAGLSDPAVYSMDTKYPTPVTGLHCHSVAYGVINLNWTTTAPDPDRFAIYWNGPGGGAAAVNYTAPLAYQLSGGATSWTTDGTVTLTDGVIYTFDVWTRDDCGNWERVHPAPTACESDSRPAWMCIIQPVMGGLYCDSTPSTIYVCPQTTADRDVLGVTGWGRLANRGDGQPSAWVSLGGASQSNSDVCFTIALNASALTTLVGPDTAKIVQIAVTSTDDAGNVNTPDSAWAHAGCAQFHYQFTWSTQVMDGRVETVNSTLPLLQPYCGTVGWTVSGATNSVSACLTNLGIPPYKVWAILDCNRVQNASLVLGRPLGDEIYYAEGQPGCVTFNLNATNLPKGPHSVCVYWVDACGAEASASGNLCVPDSVAPCAIVSNPVDGKCIRRSRSTLDPIGAYEDPITITITGNDLTPDGKHCIDQTGILKVDFQWARECCVSGSSDVCSTYSLKDSLPRTGGGTGYDCDTFFTGVKMDSITCTDTNFVGWKYTFHDTTVCVPCEAGWRTFAIDAGDSSLTYTAEWMNKDSLAWITESGTNIWLRGVIYDDQGNIFYTPCVQVCIDIDTPPLCIRTENLCPGGRLDGVFAKILAELNWPQGNIDDIEYIYLYSKKSSDPDIFSSWSSQGYGVPATNSTMWTWNLHLGGFQDQTYYDFRVIAKTVWGTWSYDLNGDQQFDAHTFDTTNCDAKTWLIDRTAPNVAIDTAWTTINGNDLVIPNVGCRVSDPKGYMWTQFGNTIKVQPTVYPLRDMGDVVKTQWTLYDGAHASCTCYGPVDSFKNTLADSYVFAVNEGAHAMDPLVFDPTQAPFVHKTNGFQTHVLHVKVWDGCGNTTEDCATVYLLDIDTTEAIIIDPLNDDVFCTKEDDGGITLTAATLLDNYMKKAVFAYRAKGATDWTIIDSVQVNHTDTNGVLSVTWYPEAAGLADGDYEVTVWAVDKSLNRQTREFPITIHLSCSVPTVALTHPTVDDPKFIGCPIELMATASSPDPLINPITKVCFYYQPILSSSSTLIGCDEYTIDGIWSIHLDPHASGYAALTDGKYYMYAVATNKAGRSATSAKVMVKVDKTAPWTKLIQVNGDRSDGGAGDPTVVTSGATVPLYVLSADDQSPHGLGLADNCGLDSVIAYVTDDLDSTVVFGALMTPVDSLSALWTIDWPTTGLRTGYYRVWSKAVDCACNSSTCNCNWYVHIVNPVPAATISVTEAVDYCGYANVKNGLIHINLTPATNSDIAEVEIWRSKATSSDVHDQWTFVGIQPIALDGIFTVEVSADSLALWSAGLYRLRAFYKSTDGLYIDDGDQNDDFDDFTFDPAHKPWQMWLNIDRSVTPFTVALDPNMTLKAGRQVQVTVTPSDACDVHTVCYGVVAENGNYGLAKDGCDSLTHFSFNPVDSGLVSLDHGIWHGSVRATVTDGVGNSELVEEPLWILDMDSNQVRVTSPVHGDYVTGAGDTLTSVTARRLTSATGATAIDSVRFFWGPATGTGTYIGKGVASGETYTSNWNIKDVPEGEQYIWGEAYRGSSLLDNSPYRVWVIVIKSPKNIVLRSPNPYSMRTVGPDEIIFVGGRVDLCLDRDSISSIVNGVGIDSVVFGYRFGNAPGGPVPNSPDPSEGWVRINSDRYGSLCVDWFTCDSTVEYCRDGRYALVAWVYDKAGHVNHSNIVHVMVDCTDPYSEIVDIDGDETFGDCHDITLTGTATTVKFKANAIDDRSCAGTTPSYNSGAKYLQFFVGQCGEGSGGAADIVFVVDGSGSMSDDQAAIANNATAFAQAMGGVDVRYGVLGFGTEQMVIGLDGSHKTGGAGLGEFTADPTVLATMVDSVGTSFGSTEYGLTAMNDALAWYPWRAGATKVLILVSDASSQEGAGISALIQSLVASGAMVNTVYCLTGSCDGTAPDTVGLSTLAPSTQGLALDINASSWGANLAALATQIRAVAGTGTGNDVGIVWGKQVVLADGQDNAFALWNPSGLKTGTYCAWTVVIDQIGNSYTSVPVSLCIYDKTPPVGWIAGFGTSTDTNNVHSTVHEYAIYSRSADTDIDHVQIQYRSATSQNETDWTGIGISAKVNGDSTLWMATWNPCLLTGDYEFRMVPTDKSGNEDFDIQPKLSVQLDGACGLTLPNGPPETFAIMLEDRAFANLGLVNVDGAPLNKRTSMIAVYADLNAGLAVEKVNLREDVGVPTHFMGSFDDSSILTGGTGWFWAVYNDFAGKKTYLKKSDLNVYLVDNVGFPGTLTNATTGAKVKLQNEALTSTNGVVIFPARVPTVWLDQQHMVAWPTSSAGMLTAIRLTTPLEGEFNAGRYAEIEISYDKVQTQAAGIADGDLSVAWWDSDRWNTNHDMIAIPGKPIANGKAYFASKNLHGVYAVVSKGGIVNKGAVEVQPTTFLPMVGSSTDAWPTFHTIVRSKLNLEYENHDIDRDKIIAVLDGQTIFTDDEAASGWYGSWDDVSGLLEIAPDPKPLCGGDYVYPEGGSAKPTVLPGLASGSHTIIVQAFNKQGFWNVDTTTFTVDAAKPVVTAETNRTVCPNATFHFSVTDAGVGVNWDSVFIDVHDFTASEATEYPLSRLIETVSPDDVVRNGDNITFTLNASLAEMRRVKIVIYDGVRDDDDEECGCVRYNHVCDGVPDLVGNHTEIVEVTYTIDANACVDTTGGTAISVASGSGSSNPFDPNSAGFVAFDLNGFAAGGGKVTATVYDLTGERVKTLSVGPFGTTWDGRSDEDDKVVAEGVYLVHFQRTGGMTLGATSQVVKVVVKRR